MAKRSGPKECKDCGEVKSLSKRGLCRDCAYKRMLDSVQQLHEKQGPLYEKWRINLLRSLGKAENRYRFGIEQALRESEDQTEVG